MSRARSLLASLAMVVEPCLGHGAWILGYTENDLLIHPLATPVLISPHLSAKAPLNDPVTSLNFSSVQDAPPASKTSLGESFWKTTLSEISGPTWVFMTTNSTQEQPAASSSNSLIPGDRRTRIENEAPVNTEDQGSWQTPKKKTLAKKKRSSKAVTPKSTPATNNRYDFPAETPPLGAQVVILPLSTLPEPAQQNDSPILRLGLTENWRDQATLEDSIARHFGWQLRISEEDYPRFLEPLRILTLTRTELRSLSLPELRQRLSTLRQFLIDAFNKTGWTRHYNPENKPPLLLLFPGDIQHLSQKNLITILYSRRPKDLINNKVFFNHLKENIMKRLVMWSNNEWPDEEVRKATSVSSKTLNPNAKSFVPREKIEVLL